MAVDETEVECIWATLKEENRNTPEARRRVFFAFISPAPGINRGEGRFIHFNPESSEVHRKLAPAAFFVLPGAG
jgi:hypothetical protein